ncbi:gas vesicle protein [Streptomyces noursei]|nr:gas vesicle protein [Streptomyces noursei]MCZ0971566.1 gas vesicle protein [Streptomyces noursei]
MSERAMAAREEDHPQRARRTPRRRTEAADGSREERRAAKGSGTGDKHRVTARRAMHYAAEQLQELLGRAPESVSAVTPTSDGWQADVEVLELERVPPTTSVMASYRVKLDEEGELVAYERIRRYTRGQIDKGR